MIVYPCYRIFEMSAFKDNIKVADVVAIFSVVVCIIAFFIKVGISKHIVHAIALIGNKVIFVILHFLLHLYRYTQVLLSDMLQSLHILCS